MPIECQHGQLARSCNTCDLESQVQEWETKANTYQKLMDAHAKELDRAMELLRRAETEMRYAGWGKFVSDNPARKEVFDDIVEFLK